MRKTLTDILKVSVTAGLMIAIFRYFFHFENLPQVWTSLASAPLYLYLIVLVFFTLNWGLESKKWQILVQILEPFSYKQAIKSTAAGAAVSNILPFRIGEYLGRIIYLKPENHIPAAFNSVLGSSCQFVISIIFGIPAIFYIMDDRYHHQIQYAFYALIFILAIFVILFWYFKKNHQFKFKWLQNLAQDIRKFKASQIFKVLGISFFRYTVFASCYVWLFTWFHVPANTAQAYAAVASIYFLQSFAPSMLITDAGLRTALPLLVFNPSPENEAPILAAALINYAFNILLPSLIGLYYIVTLKFKTR